MRCFRFVKLQGVLYTTSVPQDVPMTYIVFHTADQTKIVNGIIDLTHSDVSLVPYTFKHFIMALFHDSVSGAL